VGSPFVTGHGLPTVTVTLHNIRVAGHKTIMDDVAEVTCRSQVRGVRGLG
jgi:hypothetical protein